MAPGTDMLPLCGFELDNGCCKNALEDSIHEELENSKQEKAGKPPRNLPGVRHCISQAMLAGVSDLDLPTEKIGFTSPSADNSHFLPIFRSGSCSEKGPKPYMEDEYICIDNLLEHLGTFGSSTGRI